MLPNIALHPAYDPKTNTWYITHPYRGEAPTIRELLTLIRGRHTDKSFYVVDYYADGKVTPPPVWPSKDTKPKALSELKIPEEKVPERKQQADALREKVLDLWVVQQDSEMIAKVFRIDPHHVRQIVTRARDAGDVRAVRVNGNAHKGEVPNANRIR